MQAQLAYAGKEKSLFDELRYGLFLGSERFVDKWKKRLKEERHREKPQVRKALKNQGLPFVVEKVFSRLGVEDRVSLLKPIRRVKRPKRDLAIYIISHLGLFTHQEIGNEFGVGYTSITGALKRARGYIDSNRNIKKKVEGILSDI